MNQSEINWYRDQRSHGWIMPRAAWWKRLPVIRAIRAAIAYANVNRHAAFWAQIGIGLGGPNQFDLWVCYGIRTGKELPKE